MDIPMELSGNFMELRNDHFHSGLDLRTGGQEGQPVKAVGDGWVSRIKISPWGYGKAVYIDHPNGYTTVYAHLRDLVGNVAQAAMDAQYREKCFDIDLYPEKGSVPVTAGQRIGHSGNTGGSGGPHLHFEVRNSGNQHALDPETFGLRILDKVPPAIHGLRVDPLTPEARVSPYPAGAVGFPVIARNDSTYALKAGSAPMALGAVGISVNVSDRYSSGTAKCGIRKLEVSVDGVPSFSAVLDHVDFGVNRYANAYMDYRLFKEKRMDYNRCYRLPNNKLAIYGSEPVQGRIQVEAGRSYAISVVATDASGNRSKMDFILKGADSTMAGQWAPPPPVGEAFAHAKANSLSREGFSFNLPANSLYEDAHIDYRTTAGGAGTFSPWHHLLDQGIPLQTAGELSIAVNAEVPAGLHAKLCVVRKDRNGKTSAIGGKYAQGRITASTRSLGAFTVQLDTVPPRVIALDLKPQLTGRYGFTLKVDDDLSGIGTYNGYLDGEWILLEYEPKNKTLTHTFDKRSDKTGKRQLVVEVSDERRNRTTFRYTFTR